MELLVVVAIIGVLAAIAIPALVAAREAARAAECQSNLRSLQQGWGGAMCDNNDQIPWTRTLARATVIGTTWINLLKYQLGDTGPLSDTTGNLYQTCPSIDWLYPRTGPMTTTLVYPNFIGYVINTWWANADPAAGQAGEYNEPDFDSPARNKYVIKGGFKLWSGVLHPSQYPWFMDYAMKVGSTTITAPNYVPQGSMQGLNWGIGSPHSGGTVANVSRADGSVAAIPIADLQAGLGGATIQSRPRQSDYLLSDGNFDFLANR